MPFQSRQVSLPRITRTPSPPSTLCLSSDAILDTTPPRGKREEGRVRPRRPLYEISTLPFSLFPFPRLLTELSLGSIVTLAWGRSVSTGLVRESLRVQV